MAVPYDVVYARALTVARAKFSGAADIDRFLFAAKVAFLVTGLQKAWAARGAKVDVATDPSLSAFVGRVGFDEAVSMSSGSNLPH